jgi:hypothetical protein
MKRLMMVKTSLDGDIAELTKKASHKTMAIWAADCAERILPYFEERHAEDDRPRKAIAALRQWVQTGVFRMADVRGASLAAHAAAREAAEDDAARSAARAAGQAMATAHVPAHAMAAAIYAATAVRDAADPAESETAALTERQWQLQHLCELIELTSAEG